MDLVVGMRVNFEDVGVDVEAGRIELWWFKLVRWDR